MIRIFTFLMSIFFSVSIVAQDNIVAKWSFPTGELTNLKAEIANSYNTEALLFTEGGTSTIELKNGVTTKAALASGWDSGIDTKSWQVEVNTVGRNSITVSSAMNAGGTFPGPEKFKLQYKLGADGSWTDVANGQLALSNEWAPGTLDKLPLPDECENKSSVFIRWVIDSNLDINGSTLLTSGRVKIDDILIEGEIILGVDDESNLGFNFNSYPNPVVDVLRINLETAQRRQISITDLNGKTIFFKDTDKASEVISFSNYTKGIYILNILEGNRKYSQRIIKQ